MKWFSGFQKKTKLQKMQNNEYNNITDLKEKIHELKEYLESDICKACYQVFLEIQRYEDMLNELKQ